MSQKLLYEPIKDTWVFFARYGLLGHIEGSSVSALNYFLSSLLSFMLLVFVVSLDCQWSPKEIVNILLGSRLEFCAWVFGSSKNTYCLQRMYNLQKPSVNLMHAVTSCLMLLSCFVACLFRVMCSKVLVSVVITNKYSYINMLILWG